MSLDEKRDRDGCETRLGSAKQSRKKARAAAKRHRIRPRRTTRSMDADSALAADSWRHSRGASSWLRCCALHGCGRARSVRRNHCASARPAATQFSFVPADIGVAHRHLQEARPRRRDHPASAATPACSRRWPPTASTSALGCGPGLAFIVKGSPVKGIAALRRPAADLRAGGAQRRRDQVARRPQGQEGRRLDRRLGDLLAGRRDRRARRAGATTACSSCRSATTPRAVAAVKTKSIDGAVVNLAVAFNYAQKGDGRVAAAVRRPA